MKISEVYKKFNIPPNLQEHMLTVTKVALFVADHWTNSKLDKDKLLKCSLIHDLGNIVKFDFVDHPEFLGPERARVDFWKEKQKEIIAKYGSDDHEATKKMLKELGLGEDLINIVLSKSFGNSVITKESDNWILKTMFYSDLRVLPWGIGSLEDRFKDILDRMPKYRERPDINDLLEACKQIEKQIQENVNMSLEQIDKRSVERNTRDLLDMEV